MQAYQITIEGTTPLLVNRFHEDARDEAASGLHSSKKHLSPAEDAYSRLYLLEELHPYIPAEWVRRSLIDAASKHKIGRSSATQVVAGCILIAPEALVLTPPTWEVDSRPVVIPATKGRIMRHRPLFAAGWRVTFDLVSDEDLVPELLPRRLVDDAGKRVGIGDFRPARKGPYGRFAVVAWEEQ